MAMRETAPLPSAPFQPEMVPSSVEKRKDALALLERSMPLAPVVVTEPAGVPPVLEEAERWIASRPQGAPEPTAETQTFVADSRRGGLELEEGAIPVEEAVQGACEVLGLDPLYVANEGKLIAIVAPDSAENVLNAMRNHPLGQNAAEIGEVVGDHPGMVVLRSLIGGERVQLLAAVD